MKEEIAALEKLISATRKGSGNRKAAAGGLARAVENLVVSVKRHLAEDEHPSRERLPETRSGVTRRFTIHDPEGEVDVYCTVGEYPDGRLGEIFLRVGKTGGLASGALDATAIVTSIALQHGVPLRAITSKLRGMRFPPAGLTGDPQFPTAASILDVVARYLDAKYGVGEKK